MILEDNPNLRSFLQPNRQIKPKSIQDKLWRYFKKNKAPAVIKSVHLNTIKFRQKLPGPSMTQLRNNLNYPSTLHPRGGRPKTPEIEPIVGEEIYSAMKDFSSRT